MTSREGQATLPGVKVVLIGGAPGSGKSTLGQRIASKLGFRHICIDDLAQAVRAIVPKASNPDLFPGDPDNFHSYFMECSVELLLEDSLKAHRALWPAIRPVILTRATRSAPAVIEGWPLLPGLVDEIAVPTIRSIWISVDRGTLRSRTVAEKGFYEGASDPELFIDHYVGRSIAFDEWLENELHSSGQGLTRLDQNASIDEQVAVCISALRSAAG